MIKKCFIDTETTGLYAEGGDEVHQIAAIITDADLKPLDWINIKCRVNEGALAGLSDEVAEKLGVSKDDIRARELSPEQGLTKFVTFLEKHVNKYDKKDKMHFIAYNAPFDEGFVRKLFELDSNSYYGSYFWNPAICVYRQCAWLLQDQRDKFDHMGLRVMCEFAEVEFNEDDAHDALYDTKKTLELYKKIA